MVMIWSNSSTLLAAESTDDTYLASLIQQATEKRLFEQRRWHLLLHYKKGMFGGYESEEDGSTFFNSPVGKADPKAELAATLRAFLQDNEHLSSGTEHPQCTFPARYKWLKSELSFDARELPEQQCSRLDGWLEKLSPEKITLVFASHYVNNPASMFGHTFLRIDREPSTSDLKLLNYGVNYAATVDTDNAFMYVIKGLFGMFEGTFSTFPYYMKVNDYSNIESRDLWEYELSLTKPQVTYLMLHLWELGGNYFEYFYFQENCSYHILSLLEVANPDLHLTDQFFFSVIPSDTIKILTENEGLISKRVYRPSLLSQLRHKMLTMTEPQKALFYKVAEDPSHIRQPAFQKLHRQEQALVLDAYLDFSQYRDAHDIESRDTNAKHTRTILLERSKLGLQQKKSDRVTPLTTPPEEGHGADRLKIGFGTYDNELFSEISYRPAYHDFLAKDVGYSKDSQIVFFDLALRYYEERKKIKLDKLSFVDIVSLTPYEPLLGKKSWKLSLGLDTIKDLDCNLCNSLRGNYGIGWSYRSSPSSPLLAYSMIDVQAEIASQLNNRHRAGGGGTVGAALDFTDDWRAQVVGNYMNFPVGHISDYYNVYIAQRYAINQDIDIRMAGGRINRADEWTLSINYYF